LVVLALAVTAGRLSAQEVPQRLTLDDAISIAKANNPAFLSTQNDAGPAAWGVRQAYAAFLPTASARGQAAYQQGGNQTFGNVVLGVTGTNFLQSYYNLGLSWTLDGQTIFGVPAARAQRRATDANIAAASFDLESAVALQYMAVLRAQDGVDVAQRQLDRASQNLAIVKARVSSGAAAGADGLKAQVDHGQAQVDLIKAQRQLREARELLGEQLGVPLGGDVQLVSQFKIFQPTWSRDTLVDMALSSHPRLRADRAQVSAARATARQAASRYFPSLGLSTGWAGYTQQATNKDFVRAQVQQSAQSAQQSCAIYNAINAQLTPVPGYPKDCSTYAPTEADFQAALDKNSQFPFNFTKQPLSVGLQVSIPIFTGFSRQQQVSQANAAADDARQNVRAEELALRTKVTQAYDALTAAYQVVQLEKQNQAWASEELDMKRRQYELGAVPLLDLMDAQTTATQADQSYLNAVYDFHLSLIQLDAAVGRRLERE
jgi:outer membrane protein